MAEEILDGVKLTDYPDLPSTLQANDYVEIVRQTAPGVYANYKVRYNLFATGGVVSVSSVNGQTGNVTLNKTDIGLPLVQNLAPADMPISTAAQTALNNKESLSNKNIPNGYAGLDANKQIDPAQLPGIAITTIFQANSEAQMLALSADQGDFAIRSDSSETYILKASPATVLTNWQKLPSPSSSGGGFTNPMTTSGDIIYGGNSGAPTRLGKGANSQILTLVAGLPVWADSSSSSVNKYVTNIGDGSAATFAVAHGFNTRDVQVTVYRNAAPYDTVICDVSRPDTNTVQISGFSTAPAPNAYRVIVSK